ncbi:MAG: caspase family protein [Chitinophagaceae bacterium]|nr:caspase family protein [Chitinophagaceae bacterium]
MPQSYSKAFITHAIYSRAQQIIAQSEYRVSRLSIFDAKSKLKITDLPTDSPVIGLATDSSGKFIVAATERGSILFIDTRSLSITRTIRANAVVGGDYFVFLSYLPMYFTKEHLYFTGYVDRADSSYKGNYRSAAKPDITEYYIYRYQPTTNELTVYSKHGSNKPYAFFRDPRKQELQLLAEKKMILFNLKTGKTDTSLSTRLLGLSNFQTSFHFLDGLSQNRLGILEDNDYHLRIYHPQTLQLTDSIPNLYRFMPLPDGRLLYQGTDRYFYTYRFDTRKSSLLSPDSIDFRPWCYALLDLQEGMIGTVTASGLGTVNINQATIQFPPATTEPLPWGLCVTGPSTLVYGTENKIYEFDFGGLQMKRELAKMTGSIKHCLFASSPQPRLIVTTVEYDSRGSLLSDSVFAIDYASGKKIWSYDLRQTKLDNIRLSNDGSRLLLLTGWSTVIILDVKDGKPVDRYSSADRIYGANFKGNRNDLYSGMVAKDGQYHIQGFSGTVAPFSYKYLESHYPFRVFEMDKEGKYAAVAYPEDSRFYVIQLGQGMPMREVQKNARVMAFSPDNKWLASGSFSGGLIKLYSFPSLQPVLELKCGVGKVFDLVFSRDAKLLFATLEDGHISLINIREKKKAADLILTGNNFLVQTEGGYYAASKTQVNDIGLRKDNRCYPISNADLKFNRPDLILKESGVTDSLLLQAYSKAYQKRIRKSGIDPTLLDNFNSFPEAQISNPRQIPGSTNNTSCKIPVRFISNGSPLKTFNIWVDQVPLFGAAGITIAAGKRKQMDTIITVPLIPGKNLIEAECTSMDGIRSIREQVSIQCKADAGSKTWFIGIGIDRFSEKGHDLNYSVKDIRDLAAKCRERFGETLSIDTLFNEAVSSSAVKALRTKMKKTAANDRVIIAYSGHGLLSKDFDYYLSTYSVNFDHPEQNGLAYEELESLLDSIPARKKLMLIDACHSGEVDKEEMTRIEAAADSLQQEGTKGGEPRYTGKTVLGMKNSFELMQSLFVNVGRSTGATIISAAAGTQFALERGDLKNGVFTYSILEALNKYPSIKISELKKIVGERVEQITKGLQKPTSRSEVMAVDWRF